MKLPSNVFVLGVRRGNFDFIVRLLTNIELLEHDTVELAVVNPNFIIAVGEHSAGVSSVTLNDVSAKNLLALQNIDRACYHLMLNAMEWYSREQFLIEKETLRLKLVKTLFRIARYNNMLL